jgi:hypothetical protein
VSLTTSNQYKKLRKKAVLTFNNFYRKEIPSFSLPPFSASFTFNMPSYQHIVKVILIDEI